MLCIAEQDFPMWVLVFERLGPGSTILVFTGAVLWKLLPGAAKLLTAWRRQSEEVTVAIPKFLDGMKELVSHGERIADAVAGSHDRSPDPDDGEGGAAFRLRRGASHPGVPRRGRGLSEGETS